MGPFEGKKIGKSRTVPKKIERGDPSVSSAFANARKSFWLKKGLETVTAGFTVNRVKSVLECGTYTMRSVVRRKKKEKLAIVIVGLFSLEKRRLKIARWYG